MISLVGMLVHLAGGEYLTNMTQNRAPEMSGHSRSGGDSASTSFGRVVGDGSLEAGICGIEDFMDRLLLDFREDARWSRACSAMLASYRVLSWERRHGRKVFVNNFLKIVGLDIEPAIR